MLSDVTIAGISIVTIICVILFIYVAIHWYYLYKYQPNPSQGKPHSMMNLFKGGEYY